MRELIVKYEGYCKKCDALLETGNIAMYEKSMGIFCKGCEPTDTEEIRKYRQEKADVKADKYEDWASKRENRAHSQLNSYPTIRSDHAFNTQPGHIPFRARMIKADDKAYESLNVAKNMRDKAESLRKVVVKGDAEKRREKIRDALDARVEKGTRIFDFVFGKGEVVRIYAKSYGIKFDRLNRIISRDKSYIKLLSQEVKC